MTDSLFHLYPDLFGEREKPLLQQGPFAASTFRYPAGVAALRMQNELGHLIMLPFQGQQIWSAEFRGRNLTMKSMFDQPRPTQTFLETYGGFLLHCGATAMGGPSPEDTHPLHGELPNAPYRNAFLRLGEDERGRYLALGGQYQHTVAFSHNYLAEPLLKLYAGSSVFRLELTISNLKQSEMDLMYLAHINFRPADNGRLVYSAPCTPEHVRVRRSIPSHIRPKPGYVAFIEELAAHPERANVLAPGLMFDPEVVFIVDYQADAAGWAHTLHVHPDGSGDIVRHRPAQLDKGVRWICRTGDQDALGMVEPATAEPEGYLAEKAKGRIKIVPPGGVWQCQIEMGALAADEVQQAEAAIANSS